MQRSVLITGCSSGIGLVAAQNLAQRGYRVFAACRKTQDVERMQQLGLEGIQLDLDNSQSVQLAAEKVLSLTQGRLYALFNNAGYGLYGALHSVTRQQLEQQFSTNLFGTHELTQYLLPPMLQQGEGRVIQTSSVLGLVSTARRGAYAASKYALEAWSDALRLELHGSGLHVCLIEPGPISSLFRDNVQQTQLTNPVNNPQTARRFTLPPSAILPKLHHALESQRPKIRYRVTKVTHTLALLKRLLPDRCLDKLLREKMS